MSTSSSRRRHTCSQRLCRTRMPAASAVGAHPGTAGGSASTTLLSMHWLSSRPSSTSPPRSTIVGSRARTHSAVGRPKGKMPQPARNGLGVVEVPFVRPHSSLAAAAGYGPPPIDDDAPRADRRVAAPRPEDDATCARKEELLREWDAPPGANGGGTPAEEDGPPRRLVQKWESGGRPSSPTTYGETPAKRSARGRKEKGAVLRLWLGEPASSSSSPSASLAMAGALGDRALVDPGAGALGGRIRSADRRSPDGTSLGGCWSQSAGRGTKGSTGCRRASGTKPVSGARTASHKMRSNRSTGSDRRVARPGAASPGSCGGPRTGDGAPECQRGVCLSAVGPPFVGPPVRWDRLTWFRRGVGEQFPQRESCEPRQRWRRRLRLCVRRPSAR
ncbi:hypothetical protein VTK73DRAFT_1964 [Phialemonium thermophilum]|uniref:Uncharacterized protein n=1 Tax=Phialemonium thermophilum TaxID=223376 RepID=A0ABR3VST4_9PEZI